MEIYTATFASHYGAVHFKRTLEEKGYSAYLRPVPRSLSASCGTCVVYTVPSWNTLLTPDLEGVYAPKEDGYTCLWRHA